MGIETRFAVKHREHLKEPEMYRVVLLNDDYTTMDFVVTILELVFHKPTAEAEAIMLDVHKNGRGVAGLYTEDVARTKAAQVHALAVQKQFPLVCVVEPDK
ncbi:MAG: ATP-dependent Clp protease adaptor ClpS [Spirochaetaceae bacterium]|jgi:ATP-dependent Clp protease adaptor protein ClpS|nr:ATP-dependent Clp protease adaptor ClpS [Spirochaetaceae bacterium]